MPLSTQLFLSILHPKRKLSFPFVSTLSLELPLSHQLSLLLLISSPSSGFQKVTLPTPWISSDLRQSYLNHCRTPHCPVTAPLKPFPAMFLSWHSPAQHHPVIFHNLERSSPSVQAQHTASWRSTSFQPHLPPLGLCSCENYITLNTLLQAPMEAQERVNSVRAPRVGAGLPASSAWR